MEFVFPKAPLLTRSLPQIMSLGRVSFPHLKSLKFGQLSSCEVPFLKKNSFCLKRQIFYRIGRTGRGVHIGTATTMVNSKVDEAVLADLKHLLIEAKQKVKSLIHFLTLFSF